MQSLAFLAWWLVWPFFGITRVHKRDKGLEGAFIFLVEIDRICRGPIAIESRLEVIRIMAQQLLVHVELGILCSNTYFGDATPSRPITTTLDVHNTVLLNLVLTEVGDDAYRVSESRMKTCRQGLLRTARSSRKVRECWLDSNTDHMRETDNQMTSPEKEAQFC